VTATILMATCLALPPLRADERPPVTNDDAFGDILQPAFRKSCVKCHGRDSKVEGKVNLFELKSTADLTTNPVLVRDLIEVLESGYMPPEDEPPLAPEARKQLVVQ